MKISLLVDSLEYIENNCYQHQLLKTLQNNFDVCLFTMNDVFLGKKLDNSKIILCLKLRTLSNDIVAIKKFLDNKEIYVYEQDPWESFKDDSQYKGSYYKIYNELNVLYFLNTSKWWSNFINSQGIRSKFVKMWMLPEYCSSSPDWFTRPIDLGFCGQIHPYRKVFFDYLSNNGITVKILKPTSYQGFLENLSTIKIFVHNEQVDWKMNGKKIPANALWIKDIEAASRGCISIRDFEEELENYAPKNLSTILTYKSFDQSLELIKKVLTKKDDIQDKINESVDLIKNDVGWKTVINALE